MLVGLSDIRQHCLLLNLPAVLDLAGFRTILALLCQHSVTGNLFSSTVGDSFCQDIVFERFFPLFPPGSNRRNGAFTVERQNSSEFNTCRCHVDLCEGTEHPRRQSCIPSITVSF